MISGDLGAALDKLCRRADYKRCQTTGCARTPYLGERGRELR